jgi:hypothetical protein
MYQSWQSTLTEIYLINNDVQSIIHLMLVNIARHSSVKHSNTVFMEWRVFFPVCLTGKAANGSRRHFLYPSIALLRIISDQDIMTSTRPRRILLNESAQSPEVRSSPRRSARNQVPVYLAEPQYYIPAPKWKYICWNTWVFCARYLKQIGTSSHCLGFGFFVASVLWTVLLIRMRKYPNFFCRIY